MYSLLLFIYANKSIIKTKEILSVVTLLQRRICEAEYFCILIQISGDYTETGITSGLKLNTN